jgi:heat shock protein HslJ
MRRLTTLVLLAALGLTACTDDGGTEVRAAAGAPAAATQADLVRRDWRIEAVTDADGEHRDVDPTYDAVLRFDGEGGFGAETCNASGGNVLIGPTTLEWGDEIASTSMACTDEDLTWLETTMGALFAGTSTWELTDGALRIEGNGITVELSERPQGFPTEMVQLATNGPNCECEWQFGYTEIPDGGTDVRYRFGIGWEGRGGPGQGYGSAGLAVDPEIPMDAMWLDDVEGKLFPFGTLPVDAASAMFEAPDGTTIELHPYALPDGRLVYGEPVDASQGQVVALDADGNEIERGRVVPVG